MTNPNASLTTETCVVPDGRTLAYATSGDPDGYPVVVHHGSPGSRLFAAILADTATDTGVRLIAPDRPGYGYSSPPPNGWTWRNWPDDLAALLDSTSINRAAMLGFSGGGPFALAATTDDRATRVGVVSSVVPPVETGPARLATVPFAVRVLFRLAAAYASIAGPDPVVEQYTDRSIPDAVARTVADDFHEAFRQGTRAVARESRSFATESFRPVRFPVPVRAWHGTQDENAPISPIQSFLHDVDGSLVTYEADHLGTLLDCREELLEWLAGE